MQDLANSLESALKVRVEAGGFDCPVYTGQGYEEKETPCLIVHAETGQETPLGSGNFTVSVAAEFRYPASSEDLDAHRTLCNEVIGQLMASDLADTLSSEADNLCVFGIMNRTFQSGIDGNQWLSTLRFDCYCCILDIA